MADNITFTSDVLREMENWVFEKVEQESPFFSAAQRIAPERGTTFTMKSLKIDGNSKIVKEGDPKPVLRTIPVKKQLPVTKIAFITLFTEEAVLDTPSFLTNFKREAAAHLISDINGHVFGSIKPEDGIEFDSFDQAPILQVELGADAYGDYKRAHQAVLSQGFIPNAAVTSASTFGQVSLATPPMGLPTFGDSNWLGSKVYPTRTLASGAVVGDFNQAVYGVVDGVSIRLSNTGNVPDPETGQSINLLVENKIAAVVEMRFVWGLKDERAFVRITDNVA